MILFPVASINVLRDAFLAVFIYEEKKKRKETSRAIVFRDFILATPFHRVRVCKLPC